MKLKSFLLASSLSLLGLATSYGASNVNIQDLNNRYYAVPPFLSGQVKPNVLLIIDNSASMQWPAYWDKNLEINSENVDESFNPQKIYYGYFNPYKRYRYNNDKEYFEEDENGEWSGNFLNWLTMRRIDIALKVLVGGNYKNYGKDNQYLQGFDIAPTDYSTYNIYKKRCSDPNICSGNLPKKYIGRVIEVGRNSGKGRFYFDIPRQVCEQICFGGICILVNCETIYDTYAIRLKINKKPTGVLHKIYKKVRLGLMVFNSGNKYEDNQGKDGGRLLIPIKDNNDDVLEIFENQDGDTNKPLYPDNWTPLAETYYESTRYFRAMESAYNNEDYSNKDPIQYSCQKNFVIIITDGESTKDKNLPGTYFTKNRGFKVYGTPVTDKKFNIKEWMDKIAKNEGYASQWNIDTGGDGTYYLEGVAYWSHVTDLRNETFNNEICKGDSNFQKVCKGKQNLTIYTIYTFGNSPTAIKLLNLTAKYGGFIDVNKDGKLDDGDIWDRNGDGYADNFFMASDGQKLEDSLNKIFTDILNKASGTSIGIPTQKKAAGGVSLGHSTVLQAIFYPKRRFSEGNEINWTGEFFGWWLYNTYKIQNIREDSNRNFVLDRLSDRILEWDLDTKNNKVEIKSYNVNATTDGKGDLYTIYHNFDEANYLWEAGHKLLNRPADDRRIYTNINGNLIEFKPNNWNKFILESQYENNELKIPLLGVPARCFNICDYFNLNIYTPWNMLNAFAECIQPQDYENLIEYIRGKDYPGYRSRKIDKALSQNDEPTDENVWKLGDIIYSTPWIEQYNNYSVAFVGANDGMLHAFRVGYLKSTGDVNHPVKLQNSKYDSGTDKLGDELWAFIPENVLPYLRLYADKSYRHLYTVDLRPYVVHLKTTDGEQKILIGGMRFGGAVGSDSPDAIHPPEYACPASIWQEMKNWCESCSLVGKSICNLIPTPESDYSTCYGLSSYFALDVTDPENPKFLWEFTNKDLGFTYSGPAIVRTKTGNYVVFVSGPINYKATYEDQDKDRLKIFILDLKTGKLIRTIDTSIPADTGTNTQIQQAAFGGRLFTQGWDVNNDGYTDFIAFGYTRKDGASYKGGIIFLASKEENGKLYSLEDSDPSKWIVKDFNTFGTDVPPVTSKVVFMKCFNRWYMYFGTGRWFYKEDDLETIRNKLFGIPINVIEDNGKIAIEVIQNTKDVSDENNIQNICADAKNGVIEGWYINLDPAENGYLKEKVITDPTPTDNNIIFFATTKPNADPCSFGGKTRLWALNCALGANLNATCPSGRYKVNPPKGKLYLQLSNTRVVEINPEQFQKTASRYISFAGIAPESAVPFVGAAKRQQNISQILLWLEY